MRTGITTILFFILALSPSYSSDQNAKNQAAFELIRLTQADNFMKTMSMQIETMFNAMSAQARLTPQQKLIVTEYKNKALNLFQKEMTSENMKLELASIYTQHYSLDEMNEINAFYSSPTGKKLLEKAPEIMQATMRTTQSHTQNLAPEMQKLIAELAQKIGPMPQQQRRFAPSTPPSPTQ